MSLCSQEVQKSKRNWFCQFTDEQFHACGKCSTHSDSIQLIWHAQVTTAKHVCHTLGMPGHKYESSWQLRVVGYPQKKLEISFSNPSFAWQELHLSCGEFWIPCNHGTVAFISDKIFYSELEELILNENVLRNVPEERFSISESAFSHNKALFE